MKKLGETRVPKTGKTSTASTRVYFYKSLWGKNKVEIDVHGECRHNCIGYVTVRHPQIMFGTWEQSLNTFCNIAERYLIRKKILKKVETESGTKILVLA